MPTLAESIYAREPSSLRLESRRKGILRRNWRTGMRVGTPRKRAQCSVALSPWTKLPSKRKRKNSTPRLVLGDRRDWKIWSADIIRGAGWFVERYFLHRKIRLEEWPGAIV